jgi:beta-aspartyl-peptidase (threonine type)
MKPSSHPLSPVRILLAIGIVGAVVLLALRLRDGGSSSEKMKEAIHKVLNDQAEAWNRGDLEGYMAGYWQDQDSPDRKLTFFGGNDKSGGWHATFDRYRRKYQGEGKEMGQVEFSEIDIQPLGSDSAFVRGRWTLKKKTETVGGLFTLIFQKKPQGWCIVHDHTTD